MRPQPESGALKHGVAHAWIVGLDADAQTLRRMYGLLAPAERVRAARFAFDRDRRTYVMSHGVLRRILGWCCQENPGKLRFRPGARGKPYLVDGPAGLEFNLSHCDGFCVVGVAHGPAIGVDIERVRAIDDMEQLARQCFSPAERQELGAVPAAHRTKAFFNGWTRKEAFIKAVGDGLSYPLEHFDVTLAPGGAPRVLAIGGSARAAAVWSLSAFEPAPDVRAAVAVAAPGVTVHWHTVGNVSLRTRTEDVHGNRRTGRHDDVSRGEESRGTVFNLADRS